MGHRTCKVDFLCILCLDSDAFIENLLERGHSEVSYHSGERPGVGVIRLGLDCHAHWVEHPGCVPSLGVLVCSVKAEQCLKGCCESRINKAQETFCKAVIILLYCQSEAISVFFLHIKVKLRWYRLLAHSAFLSLCESWRLMFSSRSVMPQVLSSPQHPKSCRCTLFTLFPCRVFEHLCVPHYCVVGVVQAPAAVTIAR